MESSLGLNPEDENKYQASSNLPFTNDRKIINYSPISRDRATEPVIRPSFAEHHPWREIPKVEPFKIGQPDVKLQELSDRAKGTRYIDPKPRLTTKFNSYIVTPARKFHVNWSIDRLIATKKDQLSADANTILGVKSISELANEDLSFGFIIITKDEMFYLSSESYAILISLIPSKFTRFTDKYPPEFLKEKFPVNMSENFISLHRSTFQGLNSLLMRLNQSMINYESDLNKEKRGKGTGSTSIDDWSSLL